MVISRSQGISELALRPPCDLLSGRSVFKTAVSSACLLLMLGAVYAQGTQATGNSEAKDDAVVISGVNDSTVFGVGHSIRITGTVKQGAMAFGGDVVVEGTVEGDVAAVGGSVVQLAGARIGGDVIVLGGTYKHSDPKPNRPDSAMTIMYAGYEQELRNLMRNPSDLLKPHWSPHFLGLRLLALLFWFVVSLALTAAMPGAISRGVARLQLTSLRVALIGIVGAIVVVVGVEACLWLLPAPLSTLVGLMALLLVLMAWLVGRTMIHAATGKWLQRNYIPAGRNSESIALLLGSAFWIILSSLPYIWPFVIIVLLVTSIGLALTTRCRVSWRRTSEV